MQCMPPVFVLKEGGRDESDRSDQSDRSETSEKTIFKCSIPERLIFKKLIS